MFIRKLVYFYLYFKNTDGFINISRTHFFTWKTATRKVTSNDEYVHTFSRHIHTQILFIYFWGAKKMKISFIFPRKYKKNRKKFMHAYLIGNLVTDLMM